MARPAVSLQVKGGGPPPFRPPGRCLASLGVTHYDVRSARETFEALLDERPTSVVGLAPHHQTRDDDLASVARWRSLRALHLDMLPVTDAGVAHLAALPALEEISLDETAVTDAGLLSLAALPRLRRVRVVLTRVTDAGAARFRSRRPDVELRTEVGP